MTTKWGKFEEGCVKYLNDTYSDYAIFSREGGSNSKQPDIIATTASGEQLIIEVKSKSAQGFQFTLLPDEESRTFLYTASLKENPASRRIKSYMEKHFDCYKEGSTAGIPIEMEEKIFFEHAKDYSHQKKVDFFISKYKKSYIITPTNHIDRYFSITANYRIKNSGTRYPGKKYKDDIDTQLSALGCEYLLRMGDSKKKTFVETEYDLHLHYLNGSLATYFCRVAEQNKYSITKCSDTKNPNVIFQLVTKSAQHNDDILAFEEKIGK